MISSDVLLKDLSVFSDLGVMPVRISTDDRGAIVAYLIRNGEEVRLTFLPNGKVEEEVDGGPVIKHISYKSLLASDRFGRLRDWAAIQAKVLGEDFADAETIIPVAGYLHSLGSLADVERIEEGFVGLPDHDAAVNLLLIDGPAGIGKTEFIRQLAFKRASSFLMTQRPLLLHVQSRGRVLTFLQDLIAFSLQSLRLSVTFDQIPVLVRNGLLTLAIDGFDELGDPSGYGSAWAQVNDLIVQVRGQGTIILAGRETFIGRERILKDIRALRATDRVDSLSLQLPDASQAQAWLRKMNWTQSQLDSLEELFEPGAFSLRPFFLRRLGEIDVQHRLSTETGTGPLSLLIDLMIEREAAKFGEQVDSVLDADARQRFLRVFLGEVARDMADNQSESVDEVALTWAVESTLGDECPDEIKRLLMNRALVVAFLTPDERARYRRFSHSQLQNYFLGLETIDAVARGEMPKYLRRNLIGADFLVTFAEVIDKVALDRPDDLRAFISASISIIESYVDIDRGARNLTSLIISCAPYSDIYGGITLKNKHVDDALIRGTASEMALAGCSINQLDIRDADVSCIKFDSSDVISLVVNSRSKVNIDLVPHYIQAESDDAKEVNFIADDDQKQIYLAKFGGRPVDRTDEAKEEAALRDSPLWRLFDRVIRYRGHWIRADSDDILATKITGAAEWPILVEMLRNHGFLREENRDASGRSAKFYHIKSIEALSAQIPSDAVTGFFDELKSTIKAGST